MSSLEENLTELLLARGEFQGWVKDLKERIHGVEETFRHEFSTSFNQLVIPFHQRNSALKSMAEDLQTKLATVKEQPRGLQDGQGKWGSHNGAGDKGGCAEAQRVQK